jgi:hypothetical protein
MLQLVLCGSTEGEAREVVGDRAEEQDSDEMQADRRCEQQREGDLARCVDVVFIVLVVGTDTGCTARASCPSTTAGRSAVCEELGRVVSGSLCSLATQDVEDKEDGVGSVQDKCVLSAEAAATPPILRIQGYQIRSEIWSGRTGVTGCVANGRVGAATGSEVAL